MGKNKYKSNRAPHIEPSAVYAASYSEAQKERNAFQATQTRGERRKVKN